MIDAELRVRFRNQGATALTREGLSGEGRLICSDKLFAARLQTWLKRQKTSSGSLGGEALLKRQLNGAWLGQAAVQI